MQSNIRAARAILHSFDEVCIINAHTMSFGHNLQVRSFELSKYISRRKADFVSGMIAACYVVFDGEAVVVNASVQTRQEIMSAIEMLNPGTSTY